MKISRFKELSTSPHLLQLYLSLALALLIIDPLLVTGYNIQPQQGRNIAWRPLLKSPILQTGSNVQENHNSANPEGEPLNFRHPILYGQRSFPVIEKLEVTNGKSKSTIFTQIPNSTSSDHPNQSKQKFQKHFSAAVPANHHPKRLHHGSIIRPQSYTAQFHPVAYQKQQHLGMYNYAGGMIQHKNYFPKENGPLPPFRSIRSPLPGSTFIPVRGIGGSVRYAVEPNPQEVRPHTPIYSLPLNAQFPQHQTRQIIPFHGPSSPTLHKTMQFQNNGLAYPTSSKIRVEQFGGFTNRVDPNAKNAEYILALQRQQFDPRKSISVNQNSNRNQMVQNHPSNFPSPQHVEFGQGHYSSPKNIAPSFGNPYSSPGNQYTVQNVNSRPTYYTPIAAAPSIGHQSVNAQSIPNQWRYVTTACRDSASL